MEDMPHAEEGPPEGGPSQCQTAASERPRHIALGDGDPCIGSDPGHDGIRPQSLTMRHGITSFRWLRDSVKPRACALARQVASAARFDGEGLRLVMLGAAPAAAADVLVFAAASLNNALDDATRRLPPTGRRFGPHLLCPR